MQRFFPVFAYFFSLPCFLSSQQGLPFLDGFAHRLIRLAHSESTHKNMQSHLRVFTEFCHNLGLRPFPVQAQTILRYIAFLSDTGRPYGTVQNHISSIKHFHRLFGFLPVRDNSYSFQLVLRGCKHFLGGYPSAQTAHYAHYTFTYGFFVWHLTLNPNPKPIQAAIRALFLAAFFSFFTKV